MKRQRRNGLCLLSLRLGACGWYMGECLWVYGDEGMRDHGLTGWR